MFQEIEYENLSKVNAPYFKEYIEEFEKTLLKGWYILGDRVSQFETLFSSYIGTKHAIGVASGLDALILGIKVFDFLTRLRNHCSFKYIYCHNSGYYAEWM